MMTKTSTGEIIDQSTLHKKTKHYTTSIQKNIVTKTNTGEAILESVPQVTQPYRKSETAVQFKKLSIQNDQPVG